MVVYLVIDLQSQQSTLIKQNILAMGVFCVSLCLLVCLCVKLCLYVCLVLVLDFILNLINLIFEIRDTLLLDF